MHYTNKVSFTIKMKRMHKTKTRAQLAAEYGISRKTFYNWLKKEGIVLHNRNLITPKELELIYGRFGNPNPSGLPTPGFFRYRS